MADKTLADVPVELVFEAQQAALMRLQLYLIGRTHGMLRDFADETRDTLAKAADEDGLLDGLGLHLALEAVTKGWRQTFGAWTRLFYGMRKEAAAIPLGTLAVLHERYIGPSTNTTRIHESEEAGRRGGRGQALEEGMPVVYTPQLQQVLDAADRRVYGDGFDLSQRIWRLDQASLEGIKRTLYTGVVKRNSAWNVAKQLEQYLGDGRGCPRWTEDRLRGLTKKAIASGDRTGLLSGVECDGSGVAYNALRLARNEIQIVHHMATDAIMGKMPWIEQEKVNLSPAHPEADVCDEVAGGGVKGEGVYAVGSIVLPLHVQCLCYKTSVLANPDDFVDRLKGWMQGGEQWPQMDQYAGYLGVAGAQLPDVSVAVGLAQKLVLWLWGNQGAMDAVAKGYLGVG